MPLTNPSMKSKHALLPVILVSLSSNVALADVLATAFSYQGRLTSGTNVANGSYDFQFYLRDALAAGNAVSITNTLTTTVSNGIFTVALDFGANGFTNTDRWLEITVRTNGEDGFTTLSPRQKIMPSPFAIYSANAAIAATLSATFSGNLAGGTNLNGANIQPGTVSSNALDAATRAQLALAGASGPNGSTTNQSLYGPPLLPWGTNAALFWDTNSGTARYFNFTNLTLSGAGSAEANGTFYWASGAAPTYDNIARGVDSIVWSNSTTSAVIYSPGDLWQLKLTNNHGDFLYGGDTAGDRYPPGWLVSPGDGTVGRTNAPMTAPAYYTNYYPRLILNASQGLTVHGQVASASLTTTNISAAGNLSAAGYATVGGDMTVGGNVTANRVGANEGIFRMVSGNILDQTLDLSVNLDRLSGFWNVVNAKARPARVLITTHYGAIPQDFPGRDFQAACHAVFGTNGGIIVSEFGTGNLPGQMDVYFPPPYDMVRTNNPLPFSEATWELVANGAATCHRAPDAGYLVATKALFIYFAETNGGTCKIQLTGASGGGWVDYTNIDASLGVSGTNCKAIAINLDLPKASYQMRVVNVSGIVKFFALGLWDDSSPGVIFTRLNMGGSSFLALPTVPTDYWHPIVSAIKPDLFVIVDSDQAMSCQGIDIQPIYFKPFEEMIANCCPSASILWLGEHSVGVGGRPNQSESFNTLLRAKAVQDNFAYLDPSVLFGTNVNLMQDLGILAGYVHPTTAGAAFLNQKLFNKFYQTKYYANSLGITTNVTIGGITLYITNGIVMKVQ